MNTNSGKPAVAFAETTRVFARIGLLSFGGPAGQIALMHRILVEEKRWLEEKRFLHALNYCMLLPGPEAMQLATYAGWLMHGVPGGLVAGLLFVLPGAAVLVALSALYLTLGEVPVVMGLLFGLKAAVMAIVIEALVRVSKRALQRRFLMAVAFVAFVAIALFEVPFPLIVVGAALAGVIAHAAGWLERAGGHDEEARNGAAVAFPCERAQPGLARFALTVAVWLAVWFAPLAALAFLLGSGNVFVSEAVFFSKMATVTFGGAYAVLAYVAQQAVDIYGWLEPPEMLTGLGLAETTPGPLILVLVFVGFLGGARLSGLDPIWGGLAGAGVTLWFTFVPCFLWIFAGAPYVEKVRNVRWLASALAGVTAAVVGVIANLAFWFAIHIVFERVGEARLGPMVVPMPEPMSFSPIAALIAAAAGVALLGFRANLFAVLGAAALAGIVLG